MKAPPSAPREPDRARTPELERRYRHYTESLKLQPETAEILTRDGEVARFFDEALTASASAGAAKTLANWIVHELARETRGRSLAELPFGGRALAALVSLIDDGTVSSSAAREVLAELVERGGDPAHIVERKGLRQVSDVTELTRVVQDVLAANPAKVQDYRSGRTGLLGFFVGQVMRASGGRANPELVQDLVRRSL
jgi:glutaminyl-tRNA synthetase